ncbi:MAG: transcriptional repressor LexA [Pseudomonadota bacterium]
MLTKKMLELLEFIHERLTRDGVPPSFDEMKDHLGLRSKSGVHRLITSMEERGYIRRLPHKARALEIVKLPDTMVAPGGPALRLVDTGPARPGFAEPPAPPIGSMEVAPAGVAELPLLGRIAAGGPIEAVEQNAHVAVPGSMLSRGGSHYALEVHGDSMIDAGINDGDVVVIRECQTADNGEIVVAKVDDKDVTLKRFRQRGNTIALEPANAAHVVQTYTSDRVQIQGKLVGLIRTY